MERPNAPYVVSWSEATAGPKQPRIRFRARVIGLGRMRAARFDHFLISA
jgi:hypothetical protein